MCGRYRLSRRKQLIAEYFDTDHEVDWEPRYNIAPSQPVGIIRQDPSRPERHFSLARWGPDSVLGQRRQYRIQDDQCALGDGRE
jgi:putative SOS response-associated peptidase YedK